MITAFVPGQGFFLREGPEHAPVDKDRHGDGCSLSSDIVLSGSQLGPD